MRTRKTVFVFVALAGSGVVWACGGDDSSDGDSGTDSGTDASNDDGSPADSTVDSEIVTDSGKDSSILRAGGDSGADGASGDASDSGNSDASDAGSEDSGSDAASCITLSVLNAPVGTPWCNISIDGGLASTSGTQTVCVPSGTTLTLAATPQPGFTIAPNTWHDTVGDLDGGGDPGSGTTGTGGENTTSVVVTATTTCVWACCPGSTGVPTCPTTDQCP